MLFSSGFFNEENAKQKEEYLENTRLCKLFTKKVEKYRSTMRDDILASASLASYEYRAALFCKKAKEAKPKKK
jgi:hypothetical protein